MPATIEALTLGPLQTNCYVFASGGEAAVIDAAAEPERILDVARRLGVRVAVLVNTHGHFDHIGALAALARLTGAPVLLHEADLPLLRSGGLAPAGLGEEPPPVWMAQAPEAPEDVRPLGDGDGVTVGGTVLTVLHTPGHTPGGICLYGSADGIVFSGDTLFHRGVGRADLPGGNGRTLLESIKRRLYTLPDDTLVYPGHGPTTTIGQEKRRNPFVRPQ